MSAEDRTDPAPCPDLAEARRARAQILQPVFGASKSGPRKRFVTVVVLNFNGEKVLDRCIASIFEQNHPHWELIVVDNASTDKSAEIVKRYEAISLDRFGEQRVQMLQSENNLGVAGGRNRAFQSARGDVIAFVDNDGSPDSRWLAQGIARLDSDPTIGVVAPLVFFSYDPLRMNGAGGVIDARGHARDRFFGEPLERLPELTEVAYGMGCGMILARAAAEAIFPLDDAFLKWFDDTEVGLRAWASGYRVMFDPAVFLEDDFHGSHQFVLKKRWAQAFTYEAARIRMLLKYYSFGTILRAGGRELGELFHRPNSLTLKRFVMRCVALIWNLFHLTGALKIRSRYPSTWTRIEKFTLEEKNVGEP